MKSSIIRSSWLSKGGFRLDCSPYLGGALETEILLKRLSVRTDSLKKVTSKIFHAGREARTWVESSEFGIPFISSSDVLKSDLSNLPFISKKQVEKNQDLLVHKGYTLITRSGTIGKMAYCREEMDGMACSEHVLRVVPDNAKILSGYLFAFLSSKFGVPLVVSGTYGSIIQSIEPNHVAGLSVPRFCDELEVKVHELMEESARLLSEHSKLLQKSTADFFESAQICDISPPEWHKLRHLDLGFSVPCITPYSLRSINYAPRFNRLIETIRAVPHLTLGEICVPGTLRSGPRFTRIDAEPPHAIRLIGQKALFALQPEGRWIALSSVGTEVRMEEGSIAVAAQGTFGETELYCRSQFIKGNWTDFAYSQHLLRVIADEKKYLRGCLFAFFRSETAFRMLRAISTGSKLQDNHYYYLPRIPVPKLKSEDEIRINADVNRAFEMRQKAVALENKAVGLIEAAIMSDAND